VEPARWHQKPFGLLNIAGFYDHLMAFLDHTTAEGFIRPKHRELVIVENEPEKILARLKHFQPLNEVKWVN
jgi:predicted Rossmann-fold nucleotide-binding protein